MTLLGSQSGSGITLEQVSWCLDVCECYTSPTYSFHAHTCTSTNVLPTFGTHLSSPLASQLLSATTSTSRLATPTGPSSPQGGGAWSTGRKRGRATNDTPLHLKRRRVSSSKQTGEKQQGKGLRHFSQRVCEKVKEKGTTSYNEVSESCRTVMWCRTVRGSP